MIDVKDAGVVWASQGSCAFEGDNPAVPLRATIIECLKAFPTK
jgi:hypothetical protein